MTGRRSEEDAWTPAIEAYLRELYATEGPGLRDAARAIDEAGLPRIQISPTEGRILELLLRLAGARRVVEIGTLAGYSAQWLARGMPPDGHLWTLEANRAHAEVARGVLRRAGLDGRVTLVEGPALETLPGLAAEGPFDAVFVDADKAGYAAYGRWATAHLRPGGLLIGDNVYLFGKLVGVEPASAEEARSIAAMRDFHALLARDFHAACLPTMDGLAVGIKK